MSYAKPGKTTLPVEVTNISPTGFWLLIDDREVFVSFEHFPWFADATVRQIIDVTRPAKHHLNWPSLDVDLAVKSLDSPERFPMVSGVAPSKVRRVSEPAPRSGRPSR
jgi:hypothetical protein